ncbi:unnamed protein product [Ostreobium quekettii]|uniref:Single-stranded DNA binding protein Ssb-like OB fold domain-containing protein n=1 Tax=Ostreobium quekettii TaxID=121088 RepID=A0A8S1J2W0_9CHLO|nr:unnamed protein product [Ostreobium quekettii]|eukprot:evm.model.scf_1683EXC.7 EVM.evm.TU.scf_1683EXC.7   scf_1683EXC:20203-20943(+)
MEKQQPVFTKVEAVRPGTKGHNLVVKVMEATEVANRPRGAGGKPMPMAECLVGDDTGCIVFTARGAQVELAKVGKYLILRNARIDMFKGSMRLAVNQWGKVEEGEGDFEVKSDNNLSLVEYELVTLPNQPAA